MAGLGLSRPQFANRPDWSGQAANYYQQASGSALGMDRKQETTTEGPGQTAGGTLGNVAGGAMAGYTVGGPWGAVAGGAVGLIGSFL